MDQNIIEEKIDKNETKSNQNETNNQTKTNIKENESFVINIEIRTPTTSGNINVLQNDSIQSLWSLIENNHQLFQYSNFELYLVNENINIAKFSEIKDIPGIKDKKLVLRLQPLPYTENSALVHFRNIRNLFFDNKLNPPKTLLQFFKTTTPKKKKKSKKNNNNTKSDNNINNNNQQPNEEEKVQTFKDIFPENWQKKKTQLLKSIVFSGWNPALEYRKLQGDLFYFVVTTLEGKRIHFTACEQGFYANKSDDVKFHPEPLMEDHKIYHLLIDCLSATIPLFNQKVTKYLQEISQTNVFDIESELYRSNQWISPGYAHTYSVSQGDSYIESFKITEAGVLREWNIEFQFCKELPESTNEEIMRKYGIWLKSSTEFINASSVAARLLVDGDIVPVNTEDPISEQIYIYNNIFLTRALDSKEQMKERGGEKNVRKLFTNEITSQTIFNSINIPGIYTLGMTVVDYRGHRIVAQSLLPGIFQSETTSDVKYGSIDFGKELKYNEEFIEPLKQFEEFGIAPHEFTDESGNKRLLYTAVETKMLIGTDGRKYLLDLIRFTPRDANYPEKENHACVLRPELINHCSIAKLEIEIKKAILERNKEYENDPKLLETHWDEVKDKYAEFQEQLDNQHKQELIFEAELIKKAKTMQKKNEELKKKQTKNLPKKETVELKKETNNIDEKIDKNTENTESKEDKEVESLEGKQDIDLNDLTENEQLFKKERENKRKLNEIYLKKQILLEEIEAKIKKEYKQPLYNPNIFAYDNRLEKSEKTKEEEKLIVEVSNMLKDNVIPSFVQSYTIQNLFDTESLADVLHREGINLRYCGRIAELATENNIPHLTSLVEKLMIIRRFKEITNQKLASSPKTKITGLLSKEINLLLGTGNGKKADSLYEQIKKKVKEHYRYENLPQTLPSYLHSFSSLRSVCLQLGVQVLCKDYDFTKPDPIHASDIIQLNPRVHSPKLYEEILDIIKSGHQFFNEGNYYFAQQMFSHAHESALFIFGPVHPNTAVASANLATVLMTLNDKSCIELFENATMIYERVNGVDSPSAIYGYFDLATAHSRFGNFDQALTFFNRALFLLSTYIDKKHPIYTENLLKLAKLHFNMKNHESAFELYNQILDQLDNDKKSPSEPDTALIARVCRSMSNAYKDAELYKQALSYERRYFNYCSANFGSKDNRTKEASLNLQDLTSLAVNQQKKLNEKKSVQQKVSKPNPPVRTLPGINDMPLSKILSFINGKVPFNLTKNDNSEARTNFEMNFGKKSQNNPKKKK